MTHTKIMHSFFESNRRLSLLIMVLAISASLNFYGINFPLGYHPDETIKVYFIQNNIQNFNHPIFILQVVRILNSFIGFESDQQVVVLGRITTAIMGIFIIFLTYQITRQRLPENYALGAALLTAVAPGFVIHAHYLKEDTALTFGILLSFLSFFKLAEKIMPLRAEQGKSSEDSVDRQAIPWIEIILFGLATGLTLASKYKSVILVPLYFMAPIYIYRLRSLAYFRALLLAGMAALVTFLIINFPIFLDFETFKIGFRYELGHALGGHFGIKLYPLDHFFSFHLRHSIFPSLSILPVILAAVGIGYCLSKWKQVDWRDRFLVVYLLFFYSILEISPLKPFPDFMRYVMPLIPVLAYFCMQAMHWLMASVPKRSRTLVAGVLACLVIYFPLVDSLKLDYYLNRDTRGQLDQVIQTHQAPIFYEAYVLPFTHPAGYARLADLDLAGQDRNLCTVVASSFMYDRYLMGGELKNQDPEVYVKHQQYLDLFQRPYTEIKPAHRSFAFSNPTLRVFDLCS